MNRSFSDQIRAAIRNSGHTLTAIYKATDVPASNLSRFMNGHSGISLESLDRVAKYLGLEVTAKPNTTLAKPRKAGR